MITVFGAEKFIAKSSYYSKELQHEACVHWVEGNFELEPNGKLYVLILFE